MTVEQHLHRFLLEFFGVDPPVRLGMLVGFQGTLRSCWIGVNLSSRSVHQTPYVSRFLRLRLRLACAAFLARNNTLPVAKTVVRSSSDTTAI
jgi:hypothetical protein